MSHTPFSSLQDLAGPLASFLSGGVAIELARRALKSRRQIWAETTKTESDALAAQAEAARSIAESFRDLVQQLSDQNEGLRTELAEVKAAAEKAEQLCSRRIARLNAHVKTLNDALAKAGVTVEAVPEFEEA